MPAASDRHAPDGDAATALLENTIACYRIAVATACAELSAAQLTTPPPPFRTTVAELLRRLTALELGWQHQFGGLPPPRPPVGQHTEGGLAVLSAWHAACEQSRQSVARLKELTARGSLDPQRLRSSLLPLFAEYARHHAHLSLLIGRLDTTDDRP